MHLSEKSLIEGVSYAIDIAEKSYMSHSKHVAFIVLILAKACDLTEEDRKNVYYAALLHDIGTSTVYNRLQHANRGAQLIEKLNIDPLIDEAIRYHHETYNGKGPFELKGSEIPIHAQFIYVANIIDEYLSRYRSSEPEVRDGLLDYLESKKAEINPFLMEILGVLIQKPFFLLEYYEYDITEILKDKTRGFTDRELNQEDVEAYAKVFAEIIDSRNTFTLNHSKGIAAKMRKVATALHYDQEMIEEIYIAALLHDIGKLSVDNSILNKNGPLEPEERFSIEKHTYYSRWILKRIKGFEKIADWGSNHHEKLNGSGYPYGKKADELDTISRLIAIVDIYQALTESRPYREGMDDERAWAIICGMGDRGELDQNLIERVQQILMKEGEIV